MRRGGPGPSLASLMVAVAAATVVARSAAAVEKLALALDFDSEAQLVSCPSVADFRQEVIRRLGHDPFRPDAQRRLIVRFYAASARIEGRIEWRDPVGQWEGERTFASRDSSCRNMGRAVAFAVAVQIQLMAADEAGPPAPAPAPPPPLPPAIIEVTPSPPPTVAPREPFLTLDVGLGATVDAGDVPAMALPRIGLWLGRPERLSVRVAAHGLGPGTEVARMEGTAQLDRLLVTADVAHAFRAERLVQPLLALGVGLQDFRVHGISARPDLASAHDGNVLSAVLTASGGLMFAVASRVALVAEVQAMFFRPSVHILIGDAEAGSLDGLALFGHGGLLARF